MVSCLMFNSLSHFEFIFVYGVRVSYNFIDLHVAVQITQHHLLKRLSSPLYILEEAPILNKGEGDEERRQGRFVKQKDN